MLKLNLQLKPETEKKLKQIFNYYDNQEIFAQNIITYQILELNKAIINIKIDLKKFEDKYQLKSKEFYQKFQCGDIEDQEDFMIWSGIYEMFLDNTKKLKILE